MSLNEKWSGELDSRVYASQVRWGKALRRVLMVIVCSGSLFGHLIADAVTPSAVEQASIFHLLSYLEHSDCRFYRNGKWYDAKAASEHISKKYEYLLNKGYIKTAEDFIERAASSSSISGEPYRVKCGHDGPIQTAAWLKGELIRYRGRNANPQ